MHSREQKYAAEKEEYESGRALMLLRVKLKESERCANFKSRFHRRSATSYELSGGRGGVGERAGRHSCRYRQY